MHFGQISVWEVELAAAAEGLLSRFEPPFQILGGSEFASNAPLEARASTDSPTSSTLGGVPEPLWGLPRGHLGPEKLRGL